ncbi:Hypothetical predicted protein [Olea europaea subsp. europaea]|uniref:Uncharacterized protein n=1 Tax=Olea europaea subsp. europaea TaxID=158383 RepID=A0A8S0SQR1_OLEEU|nr:Hypothetical predicted protein [Olea europaea subsp. europaea]
MRLREFISTLVPPSGSTTIVPTGEAEIEPRVLASDGSGNREDEPIASTDGLWWCMLCSRSFVLFELDPDIEKTFQRRRWELRELRRQQLIEMAHQEGNLEHNAQSENIPRGGIPPGFGNQAGRAQ